MKPSKDSLSIFEVTERDAGNYSVVITNTERRKRTFQLLVNGTVSIRLFLFIMQLKKITNMIVFILFKLWHTSSQLVQKLLNSQMM